jgi:NAD(P)-dependent dehydrogenase (short-subunit alcohol dehydrogenase family)
MTSLQGKAAIVTGGSRGIGFAIARALLDRGAAVAIAGTNAQRLESAAAALGSGGERVLAAAADVSRYADVEALFSRVAAEFGGVDIVINNAGVGVFRPVAETTVEQWHQVLDTNLSGVFYCCRLAIPLLKQRGGGWIVNISSLASKNAFVDGAAYCASKSALNAFSEALMQ